MKFRTTVTDLTPSLHLDYSTRILSLGSCFAEEIGSRLAERKFNIVQNPFGILYNPASIGRGLNKMLTHGVYTDADIQQRGDLFISFDHHGKFSSTSKTDMLDQINAALQSGIEALRDIDVLLITFGSAHVFELRETAQVVANCHKFPANEFVKRRLSVEEIVEQWRMVLNDLNHVNPTCKVIFTVSPVRYFAEGAWENQLSKSVLHLAISKLCTDDDRYYFPAYEIVNDELRDYRFYARDMKHVRDEGVDYIFDKFFKQHFTKDALEISKQVLALQRQLQHKPLKINSVDNLNFLRKLKEQLEVFQQMTATVSFKSEINSLQKQIELM
jgi:hypothetical protein